MNYLGLDYGEQKIGMAFSEGKLAEPVGIVFYKVDQDAYRKIGQVIDQYKIDKVIIGLPGSRLDGQIKDFALNLRNLFNIETSFIDETLTSRDAVDKMKQIGKKIEEEDAISAALILQNFLDHKDLVKEGI